MLIRQPGTICYLRAVEQFARHFDKSPDKLGLEHLRHSEVLGLEIDQIQQREGRWVIPDLVGKGNRLLTVTVPAAVKVRIEEWIVAADLYEGKVFRSVNKADRVAGTFPADEKAIWQVVVHYAEITSRSASSLRMTCVAMPNSGLCRIASRVAFLGGNRTVRGSQRFGIITRITASSKAPAGYRQGRKRRFLASVGEALLSACSLCEVSIEIDLSGFDGLVPKP